MGRGVADVRRVVGRDPAHVQPHPSQGGQWLAGQGQAHGVDDPRRACHLQTGAGTPRLTRTHSAWRQAGEPTIAPVRVDLVVENANIITIDPERPRLGPWPFWASTSSTLATVTLSTPVVASIWAASRWYRASTTRTTTCAPTASPSARSTSPHRGSPPSRRSSATIARRVEATESGTWVIGSGYDHNKLAGGRHPTRHDLDPVSPGHPVVLNHTSGHFCVLNTVAMNLARVGDVAVPDGGVVTTDSQGGPTGLLEEQAQQLVRRLLLPHSVGAMVGHLAAASESYLREGITSAQEAGVGSLLGSANPNELAAYQQARREGLLRTRVTLMVAAEVLHEVPQHADDPAGTALDLGLHSGFGDDWLRIGPTKVFADGSLMGRTAAMFDDFAGEPGNCGYFQMDTERLRGHPRCPPGRLAGGHPCHRGPSRRHRARYLRGGAAPVTPTGPSAPHRALRSVQARGHGPHRHHGSHPRAAGPLHQRDRRRDDGGAGTKASVALLPAAPASWPPASPCRAARTGLSSTAPRCSASTTSSTSEPAGACP